MFACIYIVCTQRHNRGVLSPTYAHGPVTYICTWACHLHMHMGLSPTCTWACVLHMFARGGDSCHSLRSTTQTVRMRGMRSVAVDAAAALQHVPQAVICRTHSDAAGASVERCSACLMQDAKQLHPALSMELAIESFTFTPTCPRRCRCGAAHASLLPVAECNPGGVSIPRRNI